MKKYILNILIFILFTSLSNSQNLDSLYVSRIIDTISSKYLNEKRSIEIQLPRSYDVMLEKKYPLMIVLDGDYMFNLVGGSVDLNSESTIESKTYLIKHLDPNQEYQKGTIKGCFMDIMSSSFPNFIIYEDIKYSNNFGKEEITTTFISRLPLTIIKKFMSD